MVLRFIFGKKEKISLDGRKIIIIDKSRGNDKVKETLRKVILTTCSAEKVAKYFPLITFIFKDKLFRKTVEGNLGWIHLHEINAGKVRVYFSPQVFREDSTESEIKETIVHELSHIWQEQLSKALSRKAKALRRLHKKLLKNLFVSFSEEANLKILRRVFQSFIYLLFTEGFATFCERFSTGLEFNEDKFSELYGNAEINVRALALAWRNYLFLKEKELKGEPDNMIKPIYAILRKSFEDTSKIDYIGLHMIYTIRYVDSDFSIEDVAKLKQFNFIRKYESCMKVKGKKPIITITSGSGFIDYKKLLAEWLAILKKSGVA